MQNTKTKKPKNNYHVFNEAYSQGLTREQRQKICIRWNNALGINEYKNRKMSWGKHVGMFIKDLPQPYLEWLLLNCSDFTWLDWFRREYNSRHTK